MGKGASGAGTISKVGALPERQVYPLYNNKQPQEVGDKSVSVRGSFRRELVGYTAFSRQIDCTLGEGDAGLWLLLISGTHYEDWRNPYPFIEFYLRAAEIDIDSSEYHIYVDARCPRPVGHTYFSSLVAEMKKCWGGRKDTATVQLERHVTTQTTSTGEPLNAHASSVNSELAATPGPPSGSFQDEQSPPGPKPRKIYNSCYQQIKTDPAFVEVSSVSQLIQLPAFEMTFEKF